MRSTVDRQKRKRSETDFNLLEELPEGLLTFVLEFVGLGQYRYVAPVSKNIRNSYVDFCSRTISQDITSSDPSPFHTFPRAIVQSAACANVFVDDHINRPRTWIQRRRLYSSAIMQTPLKFYRSGTIWTDVARFAAVNGNSTVLEYALVNLTQAEQQREGCQFCRLAAMSGDLQTLQTCRDKGLRWSKTTCEAAAFNGNLDFLQYARYNHCPWDSRTCAEAAKGGQLTILKWCRENQCPWDILTCAFAAGAGHLETLKWCRENGCPWDKWTTFYAKQNGHSEILQWALKNGCPEHHVPDSSASAFDSEDSDFGF